MKLSARLIILGISGPIAGLGLFLIIASSASIKLAEVGKTQLTQLFDQSNRTTLLLATSVIQQDAQTTTNEIIEDSELLKSSLQPLRMDAQGRLRWQGQLLDVKRPPARLKTLLQLPQSLPSESASIYYHSKARGWQRLIGIRSDGQPLDHHSMINADNQREVEQLYATTTGRIAPRNTMLQRDGAWRMTRITPMHVNSSGQNLVLVVSVSNDAANRILATSANLFPYDRHRVAFFSRDPSGQPICTYQTPTPTTCVQLLEAMKHSGGMPAAHDNSTAELSERQVRLAAPDQRRDLRPGGDGPEANGKETLFIATFPYWNWTTVIGVKGELLGQTLGPMRRTTMEILMLLVATSAGLIAVCGYAALRFARSINRQLLQLATAADVIAGGDRDLQLNYEDDDALGQLVRAFNAMARAVSNREDSLRAQIRVLEIDISQQVLQGQVCSITDQPGFNRLSERARTMRERRQRRERKAEQVED